MNRRFLPALAFVAVFVAGGCTYQANVQPQAAYDVYSGYDDKVVGTWALNVSGEEKLRGEADMISHPCSFHNFPFNYSSAFRDSVEATLGNLVENLDATSALPDSALEEGGHIGLIRVQAERATAELEVNTGFWTGKPRSDARITASIHVEGRNGKLMGTTVTGRGTARASGGCDKGADVVRRASEEALQELMRELGERFSNSPRIRAYTRGELDAQGVLPAAHRL